MDTEAPKSLHELPPSAKLVFKVLKEEGRLTQAQLASQTLLAPRTVRYALNKLHEIDAVTEEVDFRDARKRIYSLELDDQGVASASR